MEKTLNDLVPTLCVGMQERRFASRSSLCVGFEASQRADRIRTRSVRSAFPRKAWERDQRDQ
ncbi:hypothetical protein [Desulfonema magnum]|uniref:hypothetical protein n=1 Tax=Desulfonema magnum TaxID=45655 RepID=UPI001A9B1CFC|nr:hypothetical protein [Desulfonema magnum]